MTDHDILKRVQVRPIQDMEHSGATVWCRNFYGYSKYTLEGPDDGGVRVWVRDDEGERESLLRSDCFIITLKQEQGDIDD